MIVYKVIVLGRCGSCMDCPNCFNALSVRASTITRGPEGAKTPGKVYYLACFICRWTTRDVGIPDQNAGDIHDICSYV